MQILTKTKYGTPIVVNGWATEEKTHFSIDFRGIRTTLLVDDVDDPQKIINKIEGNKDEKGK